MMDVELESLETEELISRPYQSHLEDIAFERNTIIHLPTGSGKTFIAISLINRLRGALKKPWGEGGKKTFFLVNTVPLVNQQKNVINKIGAVKGVAGYSGDDGVDFWDKNKWDLELAKNQVIVMTSQILADMLTHGYIRIQDINLLIFDECHHAVIDHPMRMVMKHFENCPPEQHPRVLGLTATLLNGNVSVEKVDDILKELETTFHATIATYNEMDDVFSYSTNPKEVIRYYRTTAHSPASIKAIEILKEIQPLIMDHQLPVVVLDRDVQLKDGQKNISANRKKILKQVKNMTTDMINMIEELGDYGGALAILAYVILMERLKRRANSIEEELLYKFTITHSIMARAVLVKYMNKDIGYEKIVKHSSDKVLHLLAVLKEYNPDLTHNSGDQSGVSTSQKPLSGIIFTTQRFTAKILYNLLKDVKAANPNEFGFLKHEFIVGFNVNPVKCTWEDYYTRKTSQTALLKFCNNELNCLISTSVIEEGVDIPQCLLVIKYDPPLEYRSYLQSKGRARNSESTYVMLQKESERNKFEKTYDNYQRVEKHIKTLLVGKTEDRDAPTDSRIEEFYSDDEIKPYITPYGTRLSAVSAISLLNRYCSVLPHDQFTSITPMWVQENVYINQNCMKQIQIYLPIACPVKEVISGYPQHQVKNAKRSAALNACIRLHKEGELDERTLLPHKYGEVDYDSEEITACFPNWKQEVVAEGVPKAGTKKMMRKHEKVFPKYLNGAVEHADDGKMTYYLHVIQTETKFPRPKETRDSALFDLLEQKESFGLITANPLPKVCDFPMFLTVGEVMTSIKVNYAVLPLDEGLLELIKYFHLFLFEQVLNVAKSFITFDGNDNVMFVVPVKENQGYDVNWEVMMTHKEVPPLTQPTFEERKNFKVLPEKYLHHVVTPWYREIIPSRYIVSKVMEYMSPQSRFDSTTESYDTFADYYVNKYHLEVQGDKNQPLLEVRNISSRMNCLFPRAASIAQFTEKQKKLISQAQGDEKIKGFAEIFIPEFVTKYEFPGVLWYKAIMLPSVIHRVTMLLTAHELRAEIASGTQYGDVTLRLGEEWKPIEVDMNIAIKSMLALVEPRVTVNTIDRINNPIDESLPLPKIKSMKDSIYELQKQKISKDYPWEEQQEPIDIERNINTVTVMDIECYDEFVSTPIAPELIFKVRSPHRAQRNVTAICASPLPYDSKIDLLIRTPANRGPELKDILTALTVIKSGDTFNLERAETLGDSFLKFSASLYLFHKFPRLNEGQLTNIKGRLIGNRNLYYAGERARLGGRMKSEHFSPRKDFLVPGFFVPREIKEYVETLQIRPTILLNMQLSQQEALSGEVTSETLSRVKQMIGEFDSEKEPFHGVQNSMQCYMKAQAVSDKTIADCVEALIGTYLQAGGIVAAIKVLEWFRVFPKEDKVISLLKKPVPTVLSENKTSVQEVYRVLNNAHEEVEEIMGYKFKDPSILLEALSHPSYIRNRLTRGYERLEFLGDAILDFLITSHIFEHCRELKPGELTDLRSALVNNVTFATYVVKLGLHKYICYQLNQALESAIINFIEHQERRDHTLEEDVLHLIDETDCQVSEYVEVPKVLSDVFESLAAAIYLDSGGDLQAVWTVYYNIMKNEIYTFSRRIPLQPVRLLYEKIHACPEFGAPLIINPEIQKVMVPVTFTKDGIRRSVHGVGANKFQAKRAAAKIALKILALKC